MPERMRKPLEDLRIVQTASWVPNQIVENDDLSKIMDTSDEWIQSRTGIKRRHISTGENTADLAFKTGQLLLEKSGWQARDLDLILVATMSPDAYTPSTAAIVQGRLQAGNAIAFDISAACSGFVYGLTIASRMMSSGMVKKAMVIGSEVLSKLIDWQDRTTAVLFGDGAGGVLLEQTLFETPRLLGTHLKTFGEFSDELSAGNTTSGCDFPKQLTGLTPFKMNGREVYRFATHEVPKSILAASSQSGLTLDQIDVFLLHQANARIIKQVAKRLNQPLEKFPINIAEYGNTSAASEPILLDECIEKGMIKRGDILALSGFGGGLTTGTIILRY